MLNSTQAYQLSAAFTPTFMSSMPPTSPQSMALGMQNQTAQGGIQAELYKKSLKGKKSSGFDTVRKIAGMIPGPQQPFVMGANAIYDATQGDASGAATNAIGAYNGFGGGPASSFGTRPNAEFHNVPMPDPGSNGGSAIPMDMFGVEKSNPFGIDKSYGGLPGGLPRASKAPVQTSYQNMTSASPMPGRDPSQPAASSEREGESQYPGDGNGNALPPAAAQAVASFQQLDPSQVKSMNEMQRMAMVGVLAETGHGMSLAQARALPAKERHAYQKQYGPTVVPMTQWDHVKHRLDAYNNKYKPGTVAEIYPGLEEAF